MNLMYCLELHRKTNTCLGDCNRRALKSYLSNDNTKWRWYYIDHLLRFASRDWSLLCNVGVSK